MAIYLQSVQCQVDIDVRVHFAGALHHVPKFACKPNPAEHVCTKEFRRGNQVFFDPCVNPMGRQPF